MVNNVSTEQARGIPRGQIRCSPVTLTAPTPTEAFVVGALIYDALSSGESDEPSMYGFDWYRRSDPDGSALHMTKYLTQSWATPPVEGDPKELPFLVVADGYGTVRVGLQTIVVPADFHTSRTVETWSWFAPERRGFGYGVAARHAVLAAAFDVLGAESAISATRSGNYPSASVSRRVGYVRAGVRTDTCTDDGVTRQIRMNLWKISADKWKERRPIGLHIGGDPIARY